MFLAPHCETSELQMLHTTGFNLFSEIILFVFLNSQEMDAMDLSGILSEKLP